MNALTKVHKMFQFNLSMSLLYVEKLKITQKQRNAGHSVEPIVPDFCRRSFNVFVFPYLLANSFSSLLIENLLHSLGFINNLSSNSISLILTCKLKLNCRDL